MIWLPLLVWSGLGAIAGLWFLIRASTIRWRSDQAGWRMALFAAGFGAAMGGIVPLAGGSAMAAIACAIAQTALLFVGLSALRAAGQATARARPMPPAPP